MILENVCLLYSRSGEEVKDQNNFEKLTVSFFFRVKFVLHFVCAKWKAPFWKLDLRSPEAELNENLKFVWEKKSYKLKKGVQEMCCCTSRKGIAHTQAHNSREELSDDAFSNILLRLKSYCLRPHI